MREPFKKGRGVQGRVQIGALLCGVVMLVSCNSGINPSANRSATTASGGTTTPYSATVTRTQYGIPHILANDFGSAGYGYGYSFAEDNLCVMQEDFITVRGERSQYMGPSGSYTIIVNAATANNVDSDFFWKFIATDAAIAPLKKKTPDDFKAVLGGFVAGYNRYIAELKAGDHPGRHVACAAQPWVKPIVGDDVYRRVFRLLIVASSSALIQPIASAAPPALALPSSGKRAIAPPDAAQILKTLQSDDNPLLDMAQMKNRFGSNSYALGKDATVSGQPMLLGNPHFPWSGSERFYLSHLTIPGKLDIMGASLFGLPAINIGFNDHFAWTHTVSTARRFTFYQLILNPADPTQYLYEGKFVPMTATPVTIQVLGTDGKLTAQTRMMYRSQYGPMLTLSVSGVPVLGWDNLHAYTLRDANAENDRAIEMYGRWNQAKSLDEFIAIHKSEMAVPAFTTTATGPNGKAYFGDYGVVPNVTDAQIQICAAHPMHDAIGLLLPGLPVLDGSRAACQWGTDADAPAPGIFGPAHLPGILRDDYVKNANDSYWLTNANAPLVGYNSIVGQENYDIGLRPRLAILQVQRRLAGTDGKPGNRFDLQAFEDVTLASAIYSGELARDTVMQTICAQGNVLSSAGPVSTAAACDALKKWDLAANLDSRGAHLWREFWRNLVNSLGVQTAVTNPLNPYWTTPFSAGDPVNTPRGLNAALPTVQRAFGDAINTVAASGFAFDAPLGSMQHPCCSDKTIPIFGGEDNEGAFTALYEQNGLDKDGYRVQYGNSYIQAVTWDDAGVHAEGFLTYAQSTDPASPYATDFTRAYSAKQWKRFPFTPAQIEADKVSRVQLTQ